MVLRKIATSVLAGHVKKEAGKAGPIGLLAGLAVTTVLRRSAPGAIIIGGVVVARQLIRIRNNVRARRADAPPEADAQPPRGKRGKAPS